MNSLSINQSVRSIIHNSLKHTGNIDRVTHLAGVMQDIVSEKVPGDVVETGVYRGGSCYLIASMLRHLGDLRTIWMYDTFTGMDKPMPIDKKRGRTDALRKWESMNKGEYVDWNYAPLWQVKEVMSSTGYPPEKIKFIQGRVEETIPHKKGPNKLCLLRLDTDFYSSTKHALKHYYDLISPGGWLVIDDYFCWDGCKKAVDE